MLVTGALYAGSPFQLEVVRGDSMKPTLCDGTVCVLDRSYYLRHPIAPGDVIAFRMDETVMTKRVYGAPGQTIQLVRYPDDNSYALPVPGELANLRRFSEWNARQHNRATPRLVTLTIPAGKCFVLGDNAGISYDSRTFGPIDIQSVIGKMVAPTGGER